MKQQSFEIMNNEISDLEMPEFRKPGAYSVFRSESNLLSKGFQNLIQVKYKSNKRNSYNFSVDRFINTI